MRLIYLAPVLALSACGQTFTIPSLPTTQSTYVVPAVVPIGDPFVRHIQFELIRLGYLHPGSADGVIGPVTRNAISSFEQNANLPVDGQPSNRLLAALRSTGSVAASPPDQSANETPPTQPQQGWVAPKN